MRSSAIRLLMYCVMLAFASACNDNLFHSVKLTSPANKSRVEPGACTFAWKTKDSGPVRFILATEDFATTLMDSTLAGNSITFPYGLESDSTYAWRVEQGEHSNASTFRVVDFVEAFEGEYQGVARASSWVMGTSGRDTTYNAQIRLERVGSEMKITGDKVLTIPYTGVTDSSAQFTFPFCTYQSGRLDLNFSNGAIHLALSSGGLGGRNSYRFDAGN